MRATSKSQVNVHGAQLEKDRPWYGMGPVVGDFYDARPYEPGIYSEGGYWQ
jgi:hypothetical protein